MTTDLLYGVPLVLEDAGLGDYLVEGQPLATPHALALIQLDGADTSMLHVIDAADPSEVSTGARVRVRWAPESMDGFGNLVCFELAEGKG